MQSGYMQEALAASSPVFWMPYQHGVLISIQMACKHISLTEKYGAVCKLLESFGLTSLYE